MNELINDFLWMMVLIAAMCGWALWYLTVQEMKEAKRFRLLFPLNHEQDANGHCRAWCYACERQGLQDRIQFTESFEKLQEELRIAKLK